MESLYGSKSYVSLPELLVIPTISDECLIEYYRLLKPVVTVDEKMYYLKEFTLEELRKVSFIENILDDRRDAVDRENLEVIDDFVCWHSFKYYGYFNPKISEILSEMPDEIKSVANAFEIIERPRNSSDVFKYPKAIDSGVHLSKVRAYKINK